MLLVGLTGGIGSGKSTVAAGMAERGAGLVDADSIGREIVEPDGPAYRPVVERFGPGVVRADGGIDRPALAAVVFADPDARADLNQLTHPVIAEVMAERVVEAAADHDIVVMDIALLEIARDRFDFAVVIVVDCPEDIAVARLVEHRGFSEADAQARVAAQISREERRRLADRVIDNGGDRAELETQIDQTWAWLTARARP
jgi:dephospho-CoA kinase